MLEDFGSKMEFSWLSRAMFGHLGAKVGEQERKMRQLSEKVGFLVAWRGVGGGATSTRTLGYPPLRIAKGTAGAPPGGFSYQLKKLRLRLSMDQVTQQVPTARWRIHKLMTDMVSLFICISPL